jgi:hypothetical protein
MQMFVWRSKYAENYGSGTIVVMAATVDDARSAAMAGFAQYDRENFYYLYGDDGKPQECELADYEARLEKFKTDIAADPTTCKALIIGGSE